MLNTKQIEDNIWAPNVFMSDQLIMPQKKRQCFVKVTYFQHPSVSQVMVSQTWIGFRGTDNQKCGANLKCLQQF